MYEMQTMQCELDAIPTAILKTLAPYIRDIITKIVNVSLSEGNLLVSGRSQASTHYSKN